MIAFIIGATNIASIALLLESLSLINNNYWNAIFGG